MRMDLATFDAAALTMLEVMDVAEAAGVAPERLGALLSRKAMDPSKMRMLYALAWVIIRREEPHLKFSDVCAWKLEVVGKIDPTVSDKTRSRAKARVAAAKVSGLPPEDAEKLTIAELDEYRNRSQRRVRAPRGRKR